ncbi:MAG: DUF523 domain-containing protein, partial [Candidatus Sabulitectum sp.]|nr:DUF523 domain-containing protein [Candidatus Sabulitectum sp.]
IIQGNFRYNLQSKNVPTVEPVNNMRKKPLVGVCSCLLGEHVRYDGEIKLDPRVKYEIGREVTFLPVCPENESGMPVPREPMDLFEVDGCIRMITLESKSDKTDIITEWMEKKLDTLSLLNLCGFVFKARSPSCALCSANVHRESGTIMDGTGLFAEALMKRFPSLPVEEEGSLQDEVQRTRFLEKVLLTCQLHDR